MDKQIVNEYSKCSQTTDYLKTYILEKKLSAGQRMPSENMLVQKLNICRGTVRRAIQNLVDEKILERRTGSGTYVADTSVIDVKIPRKIHGNVVMIMPHSDNFSSRIVEAVEKTLRARGIHLIYFSRFIFDVLPESLKDDKIDGYILNAIDLDFYKNISNTMKNLPCVYVNEAIEDSSATTIVSDDYFGAFNLTQYLISLGHTRILHLAGPQNTTTGLRRKSGYCAAMTANRLEKEIQIVEAGFSEEKVLPVFESILKNSPRFSAIFCANDYSAFTVCQILLKQGYSIPNDVSVAGYGNVQMPTMYYPKLTTVDQNPSLIGERAAIKLMAKIFGEFENNNIESSIVPTQLLIGASCAPFIPIKNRKQEKK